MILNKLLKNIREVLIIGMVLLMCIVNVSQAVETKIKVKADMANIYSLPDDKSQIITQVSSGTILDLISKKGEWYQVNLPPDEKEKVKSGYIHQSSIEEIHEKEKEKKLKTILAVEEPKYKGEPVSLKCKDADIRDVIRYLCSFGGLNVVFDPEVSGKVTCNLVDVPWDQVLDIILKTHKLGKIVEGNVLRTGKVDILLHSNKKGQQGMSCPKCHFEKYRSQPSLQLSAEPPGPSHGTSSLYIKHPAQLKKRNANERDYRCHENLTYMEG